MLATSLELATKYNYLEEKFAKSIEWLKNNDATKLENGRYDICEGAFALVQRYTTVPFEAIRFEAHNDYFDIQYLAQGVEYACAATFRLLKKIQQTTWSTSQLQRSTLLLPYRKASSLLFLLRRLTSHVSLTRASLLTWLR